MYRLKKCLSLFIFLNNLFLFSFRITIIKKTFNATVISTVALFFYSDGSIFKNKINNAGITAFLEITVGGITHHLEDPFLVIATQNPIEQEGTYPLPEAQLDRFMMEIQIGYPDPKQEVEIVMKTAGILQQIPEAIFDRETFLKLRELVGAVPIPSNVAEFAVRLCGATRPHEATASQVAKDYLAWGAGPRGSQNLVMAAKARALLLGRTAPVIDDIRQQAIPVLRHRIIVNHRAIGDGITTQEVVQRLLKESLAWQPG